MIGLWGLLACSGPGPSAPDPCGPGAPTWDNFAQGHVQTWCTPCHSASLTGPDRQGAPEGVDLDRHSDVVALADRIGARATGPAADMPPLGGVDPEAVERLGAWLACGAPGSDPAPDPCDEPVAGPAANVATQADADALCAQISAVPSLTLTGTAALDCLCAVTGPLVIEGGSADLPSLERVDGPVSVQGAAAELSAPRLAQIGGDLTLSGAIHTVALPQLQVVDGVVSAQGAGALGELALDALSQAQALIVRDNASLARLSLARLAQVSGDLVIEDDPALQQLDRTRSLRAVGGDLVLRRLDQLESLDTWALQFLEAVDGSVVITGNASLRSVGGFTLLSAVGGDLVVADNAALIGLDGLDTLHTVGGDLVLSGNPLQEHVLGLDNLDTVSGALVFEALPSLRSLAGIEALRRVGALTVSRTAPHTFPWLTTLTEIDGALIVRDNPALAALDGLSSLGRVGELSISDHPALTDLGGLSALARIDGALALERNDALQVLVPLQGVEAVGGALIVRDNPVLPASEIEALIDAIGAQDIAGPITVEDNG